MLLHQTFDPHPGQIRAARLFVLKAVGDLVAAQDVALITSELATNAVRHAGTPFTVSVVVGPVLRLEVSDQSADIPAGSLSDGSRHGLDIVSMLADRWGVERIAGGKRIWVEIEANGS